MLARRKLVGLKNEGRPIPGCVRAGCGIEDQPQARYPLVPFRDDRPVAWATATQGPVRDTPRHPGSRGGRRKAAWISPDSSFSETLRSGGLGALLRRSTQPDVPAIHIRRLRSARVPRRSLACVRWRRKPSVGRPISLANPERPNRGSLDAPPRPAPRPGRAACVPAFLAVSARHIPGPSNLRPFRLVIAHSVAPSNHVGAPPPPRRCACSWVTDGATGCGRAELAVDLPPRCSSASHVSIMTR